MDLKKKFWENVYHRNIKKMIGICFRYVSDSHIAEDLAHDAFLKAMHKANTFEGKGHFEAWLQKITVNTALQYLRHEKAKIEKQKEFYMCDLTNNDEKIAAWQYFTTQELLETINALPEHHKLVFNLYVIDKFSHKQIAEKLNISEGTSKSHLARARKKLQQILNDKLNDKKKKKAFVFIPFPLGFGKIDRLYSNRFSDYQITPRNNNFLNHLDWSNIKIPTFNSLNTSTLVAAAVAGLSTVLISIVVFQNQSGKADTKNNEKAIVVAIDSVSKTSDIDARLKPLSVDTLKKNNDTNIPNKQPAVVIKKKRIIRKKLIVRDTLKITDTSDAK